MRAVWFVADVGIEELYKSGEENVLSREGAAKTSGREEVPQ